MSKADHRSVPNLAASGLARWTSECPLADRERQEVARECAAIVEQARTALKRVGKRATHAAAVSELLAATHILTEATRIACLRGCSEGFAIARAELASCGDDCSDDVIASVRSALDSGANALRQLLPQELAQQFLLGANPQLGEHRPQMVANRMPAD